ncbi:hypothetical protein JHK84_035605 [Glycine max]|nr:hypothetical protein JHK84_035605 [Glycine max]
MFEYETQTRNPLEAEEGAEVADGKGVQRHGEGKDAAKVRRVEVGDGGYTQWGERFPHIALILNWNVVSLSIVYSNDSLVKSARTSLNSKVVNQYSMLLTPLTAKAVLFIMDAAKLDMVDLCDVKIVKKRGGIVDDTELVKGLVFDKKVSHAARGPTRMENAKIPVIQLEISPRKEAKGWGKRPASTSKLILVVLSYHSIDGLLDMTRICDGISCKKEGQTRKGRQGLNPPLMLCRHHQHGRWQARIARVAGNKELYLGTFSKSFQKVVVAFPRTSLPNHSEQ